MHCWATDQGRHDGNAALGTIGKQRIVDEGPLPPFPDMSNVQNMHDLPFLKAKYDMTTFDEVLVKSSCEFMDKAKQAGKPFFVWHNTTRMHVWTFLSAKYRAMQNSKTNYGLEEAGMAQMDDCIGDLLKHLDEMGEADNTIVIFTTDNGAETFTWPDGGNTPFKGQKGTSYEGGFRVPCIARWPGRIKPGTVENGLFSGLDWFPTLCAAAGNPNITDELLKGVKLGDRSYKNHLDGYNQLALLEGKEPSKRHELFYFAGPKLGAVRLDDMKFQFFQQPQGWPGPKIVTDMPGLVNIRQDPFERFPMIAGESALTGAFGYGNDFFAREFWRFVLVQQRVADLAKTAINYPPMQDPASFNLEAVKKQIDEMIKDPQRPVRIVPGQRPPCGRSPLFTCAVVGEHGHRVEPFQPAAAPPRARCGAVAALPANRLRHRARLVDPLRPPSPVLRRDSSHHLHGRRAPWRSAQRVADRHRTPGEDDHGGGQVVSGRSAHIS